MTFLKSSFIQFTWSKHNLGCLCVNIFVLVHVLIIIPAQLSEGKCSYFNSFTHNKKTSLVTYNSYVYFSNTKPNTVLLQIKLPIQN